MTPDINFPDLQACALCTEEPGRMHSPGIGRVCGTCLDYVLAAKEALHETPGIAHHPIPEGDRNNRSTLP